MLLGYKNGGKARRLLSRKLDSEMPRMPTKNSYIEQEKSYGIHHNRGYSLMAIILRLVKMTL